MTTAGLALAAWMLAAGANAQGTLDLVPSGLPTTPDAGSTHYAHAKFEDLEVVNSRHKTVKAKLVAASYQPGGLPVDHTQTVGIQVTANVTCPTEWKLALTVERHGWGCLFYPGETGSFEVGAVTATVGAPFFEAVSGSLGLPGVWFNDTTGTEAGVPMTENTIYGVAHPIVCGGDGPGSAVLQFNWQNHVRSNLSGGSAQGAAAFALFGIDTNEDGNDSHFSDLETTGEYLYGHDAAHGFLVDVELCSAPLVLGDPVRVVCAGENLVLEVQSDHSVLSWRKSGIAVVDGDSDDLRLTITNVDSGDAGVYQCVATTPAGAMTSIPIQVVVQEPVSGLSFAPTSVSGCAGEPFMLTASANGTDVVLEWQKDVGGTWQRQGTGTSFEGTIPTSGTDSYRVVASVEGCVSPPPGDPILVTALHTPPSLGAIAFEPDGGCPDGLDVTLSVPVAGAAPFTYEWSYHEPCLFCPDPPRIVFSTSEAPSTPEAAQGGGIYVVVTDANGCSSETYTILLSLPSSDGAVWIGMDEDDFTTYGNWAAVTLSGACGNWGWSMPEPGYCPPTGLAVLENSDVAPNTAVLSTNFTLDAMEVLATNGAFQTLALTAGVVLEAASCVHLGDLGRLGLDDAELDAGSLTVDEGAEVVGSGVVRGSMLSRGRIESDAVGAGWLHLHPEVDATLHAETGSLLLTGSGQRNLRVHGDLEHGTATDPDATLDVRDDSRVVVDGMLTNEGLVEVRGDGSWPEGVLEVDGISNLGDAGAVTVVDRGIRMWKGNVTSATDVDNQGKIVATGVLSANLHNAAGAVLLVPDDSPDVDLLTIQGNVCNDGNIHVFDDAHLQIQGSIDPACGNPHISTSGFGACTHPGGTCPSDDGFAILGVEGNFELLGGTLQTPQSRLEVAGNFVVDIADPHAVSLERTLVQLDGLSFLQEQVLQVRCDDLGPLEDYRAPAANAIGLLRVGPTPARVRVLGSPGPLGDALYAETLEVSAGASVVLDGVDLYCRTVIVEPGGSIELGTGVLHTELLLPVDACTQGAILGDCSTQLVLDPTIDCDGNGIDDEFDLLAGTDTDCDFNGVPDACDLAYGTSLDQNQNGQPDVCEWLNVRGEFVSAAGGGAHRLELHAGSANAGRPYLVAGSATGFGPTPFAGALVPLTLDWYTLFTLQGPNQGPLVDTFGLLDGNGRATAYLVAQPGELDASTAGQTFRHAFVVLGGGGVAVSNGTSMTIVP